MREYANKPWPETVKLYESGLSLAQVGIALGISHVSVMQRLHASGVERRSAGKPRKPMADMALAIIRGATIQEAAETVGVPRVILLGRFYPRAFNKRAWCAIQPFTREEKALIREAFDVDGLSFPDVIELVQDMRRQCGTQRRAI